MKKTYFAVGTSGSYTGFRDYRYYDKIIVSFIYSALFILCLLFNPLINRWGAIPETYYFYMLAALAALVLSSLMIWKRQPLCFTGIDAIIILFTLYLSLVTYFNNSFFWFNLKDEFLTLYIIIIIHFIAGPWLVKNPVLVLHLIGGSALIEICTGAYQLYEALIIQKPFMQVIKGHFSNSGIYSIFLASGVPAIISLSRIYKDKKLLSGFLNVCSYAALGVIICTQSRTACLLWFSGFILMNLDSLKTLHSAHLSKIKGFNYLLLISITILLSIIIFVKYPSVLGRWFIWEVTLQMILDKPLFGWGAGGFAENYMNYQAEYFENHPGAAEYARYIAGPVYQPFNEYLKFFVEAGLIGCLLLASLFYKVGGITKKYKVNGPYPVILGLIFLAGLFSYPFNSTPILFLSFMCLTMIKTHETAKVQSGFTKSVLLFVTGGLLVFSYNQYSATRKWKKAANIILGCEACSFKAYKEIYPYLRHRSPFLYNYGAELYESGKYEQSIDILQQCMNIAPTIDCSLYLGKAYESTGNYLEAEQYYKRAAYMAPGRQSPKYFLVNLYQMTGEKDSAVKLAKEILSMKVKIPSEAATQIRTEMKFFLEKR